MKILFTAFKGRNNSSSLLLDRICGEKLYLTNSYDGLKRDINHHTDKYDLVIMFGLDKNLKNEIRIESVAEYEENREESKADIAAIKQSFENKTIKYAVSHTPTTYLCNAAYYHMLRKTGGKAVLIHIPSAKNMSCDVLDRIADCVNIYTYHT
jgi:hypothetical protein